MFPASSSAVTADALIPEHLVHYVTAVSGRGLRMCGGFPAYVHEADAVLAAYPGATGYHADSNHPEGGPKTPPAPTVAEAPDLNAALQELSGQYASVTVLSPLPPDTRHAGTPVSQDAYWQIPLPCPAPGQKLRNMLRRAGREVVLCEESFGGEHQALVNGYLQSRPLSPGTRHIFEALPAYAASHPQICVLCARSTAPGNSRKLVAFAVGDFASLSTAFYMFAFRHPDAPPGTADLLLSGLLQKAEASGHQRMNLGLGINAGISFFKQKWGAVPLIPYYEYRLVPTPQRKEKKGLFAFLRR